ncbi:MAG TPA: hypothetical protein VK689_16515 [Armatimonadota bacterium]|nr:hypothetical protein [Armatimonadota bacterium]
MSTLGPELRNRLVPATPRDIPYSPLAALVQQDPRAFFVIPRYQTYPGVIVRLATVQPDHLRELSPDACHLAEPAHLVPELGGR